MRIVTGIGGFTVAWFVVMLENLTKGAHGLPYLEIRMGRLKDNILPGETKWRTNCYCLCSSIKNAH